MNQPTVKQFAMMSYTLAGVSSVIILLSFISSFIPNDTVADILWQMCFITLPISAVGAFMGMTARRTLKQIDEGERPEEQWKRARSGALINTIVVAVGSLAASISIVVGVLSIINP